MTDTQTEVQATAQASLWVPAKPETERIARAVYDSTGYDAPMEVIEFVMAEADRQHRTALTNALAAKNAELVATRQELSETRLVLEQTERNADRIAGQLAKANKALDEDDYEEITNAAGIAMRRASHGIRGQVITVQDSFSWWVMKETERRILSDLTTGPAAPEGRREAMTDAMVDAVVKAVQPYTRTRLFMDELQVIVRTAIKNVMEKSDEQ